MSLYFVITFTRRTSPKDGLGGLQSYVHGVVLYRNQYTGASSSMVEYQRQKGRRKTLTTAKLSSYLLLVETTTRLSGSTTTDRWTVVGWTFVHDLPLSSADSKTSNASAVLSLSSVASCAPGAVPELSFICVSLMASKHGLSSSMQACPFYHDVSNHSRHLIL